MAKTRSQTRDLSIKKEEEEEEDRKPTLLLNGVENTKSNNKITKRKPTKSNTRNVPAQQVKVEEETDTKLLLQSGSKSSKLPKGQRFSQEQINQLIDYVVNHGMSVIKAARKVKISYRTGVSYYNLYKHDPDKKIPAPRNGFMNPKKNYTQKHIQSLIRYINIDKMTIQAASEKANLTYQSGKRYYNKYLKDPDHRIPIPRMCHYYTQDQKDEFIGYIVNDKMNIKEASRKAKISEATGKRHFHRYFDNQNPDIATPSHVTTFTHYTKEHKKQFVSYIIDGKMTTAAAARKANIHYATAKTHFRRYLKDNNMEPPVPKNKKSYTQNQINELIGYIVGDNMTLTAASKKANMSPTTATTHYRRYLKDNNMELPVPKNNKPYTQNQINELIGYIVGEKMTLTAASKKANMSVSTGRKYYRQYRSNHKRDVPT